MKQFTYTVKDALGLHARPAGLLVRQVKESGCTVTVEKDGKSVNALRLIALMGLGIRQGDTVTVSVEGENENAVAEALDTFLRQNL